MEVLIWGGKQMRPNSGTHLRKEGLGHESMNLGYVSILLFMWFGNMLLPTISEGGIDFTIPKPKGRGEAETRGLRDGKINATRTNGW